MSFCLFQHGKKQFPSFPKSTKKVNAPIDPADVPEKVTIDVLANEYKAVELPHRKIYKAMLDGMKNSKMAAVFHVDSVCKACHHNIPNENIANPPSCASCHDKEVKAVTVGQTPHLKAAYHQMCISCHDNMGIKPAAADCADCHAPVAAQDTNKNKREVR
ncbi:cytochrome c3 family protein [Mailhella sp.]|uniref:cytochrome c3 family protein n=1 Tax=Mailhella sp. TaxID=1981029 RepID=UPI0040633404